MKDLFPLKTQSTVVVMIEHKRKGYFCFTEIYSLHLAHVNMRIQNLLEIIIIIVVIKTAHLCTTAHVLAYGIKTQNLYHLDSFVLSTMPG